MKNLYLQEVRVRVLIIVIAVAAVGRSRSASVVAGADLEVVLLVAHARRVAVNPVGAGCRVAAAGALIVGVGAVGLPRAGTVVIRAGVGPDPVRFCVDVARPPVAVPWPPQSRVGPKIELVPKSSMFPTIDGGRETSALIRTALILC